MQSKRFWVASVVMVTAAAWMMPMRAQAQSQDMIPDHARAQAADEVAKIEKELGITPEQSEKMRMMRDAFVSKQRGMAQELEGKRKALGEALSQDALDREKVKAILADIKDIQGQALDNRIEQVFLMRDVLTPGQYQKFKDMQKRSPMTQGVGADAARAMEAQKMKATAGK